MNRICTLDIDELNARLRELLDLKHAKGEAEIELENARANSGGKTLAKAEEAHECAADAFGEDEAAELERLEALRDEIGSVDDLIYDEHGPFVAESSFKDYARQLADDIGCIPSDSVNRWPITCIDWDRAARELRMDYSSVEYDGTTYLYRQ